MIFRWGAGGLVVVLFFWGCRTSQSKTPVKATPTATISPRVHQEKPTQHPDPTWENLLTHLRDHASTPTIGQHASTWVSWILSDPTHRLLWARRILESPTPLGLSDNIWQRFQNHFRETFLLFAAERYDVSLAETTQSELVELLCRYASIEKRIQLGDAILENMRRQERISISAVRALGCLGAADAVSYLRLFVDFDVPDVLRKGVIDALGDLVEDPAALDVLYELARPLFLNRSKDVSITEHEQERALQALVHLGRVRVCRLPQSEYRFLETVFTMLERKKPQLYETMVQAVIRLMLCADPQKARRRIPKALQQTLPHD